MRPYQDQDRRSADILGDERDPAVLRLAATLDQAYSDTAPPHVDAAIRRALHERMTQSAPRPMAARPRPPRWSRQGLAALAAALLLALSGMAGYLRLSGPTAASAQAVLRRAAALRLAPGEASHSTYSVTVTVAGQAGDGKASGGLVGTADIWVQAGADGTPEESAQTLTMRKAGMSSRYVQLGRKVYAYNPEMRGDDTITLPGAREGASWVVPTELYDGAAVAQQLETLAPRSPRQVHLLPRQTLDGHTVDVVEVDGWTDRPGQRTTFYFDAQSALLRGFDATGLDPSYPMPSWQVRLLSSAALPAATVPAHTFTLNAPETARVAPIDLADPAAFKALTTAYAATCHAAAIVVHMKDLLTSGQSLLAACQAGAPGVTQADLITALAAPARAALDAAVTAGQITQAQDDASLAAVQAQLTALLTAREPSK